MRMRWKLPSWTAPRSTRPRPRPAPASESGSRLGTGVAGDLPGAPALPLHVQRPDYRAKAAVAHDPATPPRRPAPPWAPARGAGDHGQADPALGDRSLRQ